ncbi:MAG: mannonate dehydratase [Bacteroidota bacterium]|nr:mannonate dehydratase [Bacteroidota bacterium]
MKENRRNFLKRSTSLAAAVSITGMTASMANPLIHKEKGRLKAVSNLAKDAGMQPSEAYFSGMNERKIALLRQMNVFGAVGGINTKMVGLDTAKPFEEKSVLAVKDAYSKAGLHFNVVEGPPSLGEKTKLGLEGRDEEIANFITFMKSMSKAGVDTICYNWMPVIGWYRTDNARPGRGGALVTAFDNDDVKHAAVTEYGEISKDSLWKNLEYFLKAVVPEAEKTGMKLAMHPDDPQVDNIKGISRIMTSVDNFKRLINLYPSPSNGITMCQGNFSLMGAEIPDTVKYFGKKKLIHFVHFRNVQDLSGKVPSQKFTETFHDEGQIDMYKAMEAYYNVGFRGPIRPDHVPTMAGDSNEFPGYSTIGSLFAWGYIKGLMEAVSKGKNRA